MTAPYIANLHGKVENANSWVFTDGDFKKLMETPGYLQFITACAISKTIIFVGISAADVAAGGHLARLRDLGIIFGDHYWITDKRDKVSDDWAEQANVQLIRYDNPDGHHKGLQECIDALLKLDPEVEMVGPIVPDSPNVAPPDHPLPPPDKMLEIRDSETLRTALNAEAAKILAGDSEAAYHQYEAFCADYDQAIHHAWYIPLDVGKKSTSLLGYKLVRPIAEGGFGTVYEALDANGDPVAVKVLHEAIRNDPEHVQSFRRGVRSMRLLSDRQVPHVVRYHAAAEIPALAVMDYVPGPTLHEKVLQLGQRLTWTTALRIGVTLSGVLRQSHQLPERVLHRDFRPKNIMFREQWDGDEDWDLVVLDFDLSWHKDSQEKSVTVESYSGYLAPEQVQRTAKYSTRSALVDSYGLGMTLYYLRTRTEPAFAQPGRADWDKTLQDFADKYSCKEWVSLPQRYFRLIGNATRLEQPRRWDISQIENELSRLRDAVADPASVRSAELLAEELTARVFASQYNWDTDKLVATKDAPPGVKLTLTGAESDGLVELYAEWVDTGDNHYKDTKKWAGNAIETAKAALAHAGWQLHEGKSDKNGWNLKASVEVEKLAGNLSSVATAVGRADEMLIRK